MILRIKHLAILAVATLSLCGLFSTTTLAFDLFGNTCNGNNVSENKTVGGNGKPSAVCTDNNGARGDNANSNVVLKTIKAAANIVAFLSGIVAIIIIIISGLTMVISGGSSEQVANARRRIIYAAVGLAVIALAWTIIRFITDKVI
jgi:hypothetical protein